MTRRLLAVASAVAALIALGVIPASAQNAPVVHSWALAPTGRDPGEPSSRVFLSYDLAPGAAVRDSVTLWNYSNVQLTFAIYPTDAFNNKDGQFDVLAETKQPTDVGSWITMPQSHITAAPHQKIDLPFTVRVPANALPGDHAGAVLAANAVQSSAPDGKVVSVNRRTGTRVYIRIAGTVRPALLIENVHTVYRGNLGNPLNGSLDVTYSVRNVGNVRLSGHQRASASGLFGLGSHHAALKDTPELLPHNAVTLHYRFKSVPAALQDSAHVTVTPFSGSGSVAPPAPIAGNGRTWAIPWLVVLLAVVAGGARRGRRVWQSRRATPPPSPPAPEPRLVQV